MLAEIEQAILDKLNANGINTKVFDFEEDTKTRRDKFSPTVFCAIEEFESEPQDDETFKHSVKIFLTVVFKYLRKESERRQGIYPIIEGVIGILTLQNLGLDITPLIPAGAKGIDDHQDAKAGETIWQIEFNTDFTIAQTEETAADLLKIGLDYYLQQPTDDGLVDAQDVVS